ncbi:DUF6519 domain-containing protein [Kitasatospora sp. NPDC004240]
MPGDYTRLSFDPLEDFSRPRAEQGRMLRDAYLNELADGLDHRLRALALDVLGPCTAPLDAGSGPDPEATGFRIAPAGRSFTIGLGRLYVHGLALDNHGGPPRHVEPGLQDPRGAAPVPYEHQPYLPESAPLPIGRHLVYVHAWEREVTAVERPELIDPAVGVETDVRMQTAWQVRVLEEVPDDTDCATPESDIPGWAELTAPSAGRLSTAAVAVPAETDPCSVPPDGGYRGWENRLYRVEVHDGGPLESATFKWARDNASVASAVLGVDSTRTVLSVARTGRDDVQRITEGSWVEVLDEVRELTGRPGFLARVVTVDRVDDPTQQVTLSAPLPADLNPTNGARRTRLRQWDQFGPAVGADGAVRAADATGGLVLEHGVQVTFSADPEGGPLYTGDHWTFAARSADGSVQPLDQAPPQGPKHYFGRLAVIEVPEVVEPSDGGGEGDGGEPETEVLDCRGVWPPCDEGCGDCTVCVTPRSHASGRLTVQDAVDLVAPTGGKVCLAVGRYELTEPVVIEDARGLTLAGHGSRTLLYYRGEGAALTVVESREVTIADLRVVVDPRAPSGEGEAEDDGGDGEGDRTAALLVTSSRDVVVERCELRRYQNTTATLRGGAGERRRPRLHRHLTVTALGLAGYVRRLSVRDSWLSADLGIADLSQPAPDATTRIPAAALRRFLLLDGFELSRSTVVGGLGGIELAEGVQLSTGAELCESQIVGFSGPAVDWRANSLDAPLLIRDCLLDGGGSGIELGTPYSSLVRCGITAFPVGLLTDGGTDAGPGDTAEPPLPRSDGTGISLTASELDGLLTGVRISDCVVTATGYAVATRGRQEDLWITGNRLAGELGGVVMAPGSSGARITVRDNEVLRTRRPEPTVGDPGGNDGDEPQQTAVMGVWLVQVTDAEVRGNHIRGLTRGERADLIGGVALQECRSGTVAGNRIDLPGDRLDTTMIVGVTALTRSGRLDLIDNLITSGAPDHTPVRQLCPAVHALAGRELINTKVFGSDKQRRGIDDPSDTAQIFARLSPSWYAAREGGDLAWVTPKGVFTAQAAGRSVFTVRGNRIRSGTTKVVVQLACDGPALINDNQIRHGDDLDDPGAKQVAVLDAGGSSLVMNANHIETNLSAARLSTGSRTAAVTGNVTSGPILLNNSPLPAPWNTINVII